MLEYKYTFDHSFLDTVFKYMYTTRGTYHTALNIEDGVENAIGGRVRYNDILMCLDQLVKDGFVTHEGFDKITIPVYRLSYQGYLAFERDLDGKPYQNLIKQKNWNKTTNRFKTFLIAINALAILIITGLQVYFDQNDYQLKNQLRSMEQKVADLSKENIELKIEIKKTKKRIEY